jgi:hypothetical protein
MTVEKAILELAARSVETGTTADSALKFTQSALNLAHVVATMNQETRAAKES